MQAIDWLIHIDKKAFVFVQTHLTVNLAGWNHAVTSQSLHLDSSLFILYYTGLRDKKN